MSLGTAQREASPLQFARTQTERDGLTIVVKFAAVDADTFVRDELELLPRLQVNDRQSMDGADITRMRRPYRLADSCEPTH